MLPEPRLDEEEEEEEVWEVVKMTALVDVEGVLAVVGAGRMVVAGLVVAAGLDVLRVAVVVEVGELRGLEEVTLPTPEVVVAVVVWQGLSGREVSNTRRRTGR